MSCTVLTWDGEPSAVSQDAIKDSRLARTQTVVDDWDEEFDRGKVWCAVVTVGWGRGSRGSARALRAAMQKQLGPGQLCIQHTGQESSNGGTSIRGCHTWRAGCICPGGACCRCSKPPRLGNVLSGNCDTAILDLGKEN